MEVESNEVEIIQKESKTNKQKKTAVNPATAMASLNKLTSDWGKRVAEYTLMQSAMLEKPELGETKELTMQLDFKTELEILKEFLLDNTTVISLEGGIQAVFGNFLCKAICDSPFTLSGLASFIHGLLFTNAGHFSPARLVDTDVPKLPCSSPSVIDLSQQHESAQNPVESILSSLPMFSPCLSVVDMRQVIQTLAERKSCGTRPTNKRLTSLQKMDDDEASCLYRWELRLVSINGYLPALKVLFKEQETTRKKFARKMLAVSDFLNMYRTLCDSTTTVEIVSDTKLTDLGDKLVQILLADEKAKSLENEKRLKEERKLAEKQERENEKKSKEEKRLAEKAEKEEKRIAEKAEKDKAEKEKSAKTLKPDSATKKPAPSVPSVASFFSKTSLKPQVINLDISDALVPLNPTVKTKPLINPWQIDSNWKIGFPYSSIKSKCVVKSLKIKAKARKMKFLLYSRSDSSRKAYYGTYSLFSSKISGRRPLTVDNRIHDYEADTEEEFEIEPDGEYLKDDDDEDEEDVDPAEKLRAADGFEEDDFVSTDNESGQDSDIEAGMDGVKLDRVVKKRRLPREKLETVIIGPCFNLNIEPELNSLSDDVEQLKSFCAHDLSCSIDEMVKDNTLKYVDTNALDQLLKRRSSFLFYKLDEHGSIYLEPEPEIKKPKSVKKKTAEEKPVVSTPAPALTEIKSSSCKKTTGKIKVVIKPVLVTPDHISTKDVAIVSSKSVNLSNTDSDFQQIKNTPSAKKRIVPELVATDARVFVDLTNDLPNSSITQKCPESATKIGTMDQFFQKKV